MFAAGGAGDSSAAQIVAPWAVGLEASRNAGSAQDAFARNRRNQDLEFASATNAYTIRTRKTGKLTAKMR